MHPYPNAFQREQRLSFQQRNPVDHLRQLDMNNKSQDASSHSMPPPPAPVHIDPTLSLFPSPYYPYQQTQQHLPPQQQVTSQSFPSPSSQTSDTIGTPQSDQMSFSNPNGKRPSSASSAPLTPGPGPSHKKARKDQDQGSESPKEEGKSKSTRGSRACTVCRRLKMKCVGAEEGPPCKRCQTGNHDCIFEESNRGKRSTKKHELLTKSLRKMEKTLDTVLRSIGNPGIASGMISRSPSPSVQLESTQTLMDSPSPGPTVSMSFTKEPYRPSSPKLHSLPDNSLNPLGLLAEASLANRRAHIDPNLGLISANPQPSKESPKVGVASDNYFKPGPMSILPLRRLYIERQVQPEMLNFVSTEAVVALFDIYFEHINIHCNLLDPMFHTPALVCSRSPFLLTTICAISSKFYTEGNPDLHSRLTELVKKMSFSVPAKGFKSVEIVQAFLLLAMWGLGAVERYEHDMTWLLLGMAIRMATDLNLHRKTSVPRIGTLEGKARDIEVHNRERTWIMCYCLDRSHSAQLGKPHTIKEDSVIRNSHLWCRSPVSVESDINLAAYLDLQRIQSRTLDFLYSDTSSPSGLQVNCDYLLAIRAYEAQLEAWAERWLPSNDISSTGPKAIYKHLYAKFYYHYSMLVMNSFGLQNALEKAPINIPHFFVRCHSSATTCALIVRDELGPSGYLKYSPDSHFVFTSYALLSLLKLVRPEFKSLMGDEDKTFALVRDVADVLERAAVNPHHTPALYSGFLRALVTARTEPGPSFRTEEPQTGNVPDNFSSLNGQTVKIQNEPQYAVDHFQFASEMGPAADLSTFPPTMMSPEEQPGMMGDSMLNGFWDSVLVPGYSNPMEGLSGGYVFGLGGGMLTPRMGGTPLPSGSNTPPHVFQHQNAVTQQGINPAFVNTTASGVGI